MWTQVFAFAVLAVLVWVLVPGRADAALWGQQEIWNTENLKIKWGPANGEVFDPIQLATNPVDGSVFVGDLSEDRGTFRVQKFSANGTFLGKTASIPSKPGGVIGIAVNPSAGPSGRFYVIQTAKQTSGALNNKFVAEKLWSYSMEPSGTELPKVAEPVAMPAVGSGNAIVTPREIAADPSTGNIVILALNEAGQIVLQRVNPETGALVTRYTEAGTTIAGGQDPSSIPYSMAVDQAGKTYVVASEGSAKQSDIRAYTLASDFSTASLVAVPGFAAATASEGWPSSNGSRLNGEWAAPGRFGKGAQMAVATAPDGNDTIYIKTEHILSSGPEEPGSFLIRGFSVGGKATTVVYGNLATEGACAIQSRSAALAPGKEGTLVVLSQGQFVEEEGEFPLLFPTLLRFGPNAGTACSAPAAALELKKNGTPVTSVTTGSTVTLDGSASELHGSQELAETTWEIENAGGGVETVSAAAPAKSKDHEFNTAGTFTIRERIVLKAPGMDGIGPTFPAQPQTLEVTGGVTPAPTVTSLAPTHGSTAGGNQVVITGTELANATKVEFGTTSVTTFAEDTATTIKLNAPAHAAGVVHVTVTTAGGPSAHGASDEYTYEAPVTPSHTLTVTLAGSGSGSVTCNGVACASSYSQGTVLTLAAAPASGSTFAGWGGDCAGTSSCTITISADKAVTATFNATPSNNNKDNNNGNGGNSGGSTPPPGKTPPSNTVVPGSVKPKGTTAMLTVTVPGAGSVVVSGKGLVGAKANAKGAGPVQLKLALTSAEKKTLAQKGKVTIKVKIVFTPTGGSPGTTTKTVTFKAGKGH
jgi:hypothetical protein